MSKSAGGGGLKGHDKGGSGSCKVVKKEASLEAALDKVQDVLSLSGSVNYDPLKRELTARCGSLEANIATLGLSTDIALGKRSIEDVQKHAQYKQQIEAISCSAKEDPACAKNLRDLEASICQNVQALKPSDPPLDYYENAFDAQCGPPKNS